jgi:phosphohistidine phosphatase
MPGSYELYLIRHAVAEDRSDAWPDDTKRPLSADGIARMRKAVRALPRLDVAFDVILTSPLVRTRQTADIVAGVFADPPPIVEIESLRPGSPFAAITADLEKQSRRGAIALVGHEPGIGELAARLLGARPPLAFKKGAIARIDIKSLPPSGQGTLRWFMTTRILRQIQK